MNYRKLLLGFCVIIMVSIGVSLTLKAEIGVGAWDALAQTGSDITGIKVGTVGMLLNGSCVVIQLLILKKDFMFKHLLQFAFSFILGYAINFVFYNVFQNVEVDHYVMRLLFLLLGYVINALSVSIIMLMDVITFPLEGACVAIADRTKFKFHNLRQAADVLSIIGALGLAFMFATPITVREGTVIGMLIFSPLIGFFMKTLKPHFVKYGLAE